MTTLVSSLLWSWSCAKLDSVRYDLTFWERMQCVYGLIHRVPFKKGRRPSQPRDYIGFLCDRMDETNKDAVVQSNLFTDTFLTYTHDTSTLVSDALVVWADCVAEYAWSDGQTHIMLLFRDMSWIEYWESNFIAAPLEIHRCSMRGDCYVHQSRKHLCHRKQHISTLFMMAFDMCRSLAEAEVAWFLATLGKYLPTVMGELILFYVLSYTSPFTGDPINKRRSATNTNGT